MRAVVHIGTEKTGTTTLQEFLHRNRERLRKQGVLFTQSAGKRNNQQIAVAAYSPDRRDDATIRLGIDNVKVLRAHQTRVIDDLAGEIASHDGDRVLVSSEHLQSRLRNPEEIRGLEDILSSLGLREIEIIVYLRDPREVCRSLYASAIAMGSTMRQPPAPETPYFEIICNHRRTLENWAAVFGADVVRPRLYEQGSWVGGSLIEDFCLAAGIEFDDEFVVPPARNESLSHLGLEVLRRINAQIPRISKGHFNRSRAALVALVRTHCKGASYVPGPEIVEAYHQHFNSSNEWVRKHYFPERKELFPARSTAVATTVQASEGELDDLAELVVAAWRANTDAAETN
jgi:hypothetical protein